MSWIKKTDKSWFDNLCINTLKSGPVPKHVAFIMDGNRRFAQKNSIARDQGHLMGFEKLAETLEWCLDLGITEVTVYAFSIENFKRSKDEVGGLMELAKQKFARLLQETDMIEKHGVCFRVLGNLTMLPTDLQEMIAKAVQMTQHNSQATLNVCFAYTSRDEMCTSMREIAEGVEKGLIYESDVSERLMEKCLYTNKSHDPDLLVRTSGEVRLSDFLLWQGAFSVLSFMEVLWPEFSKWHLYGGVLHYQRNYNAIKMAKESLAVELAQAQRQCDYECVLQGLEQQGISTSSPTFSIQDAINNYSQNRKQRIAQFLHHVDSKRSKYFESLAPDVMEVKS